MCIISPGGAPYNVSYLLQVSRIIGRICVLSRLVAPPIMFPISFRYLAYNREDTCIISPGGAPYNVSYLLQVSRIIGRIRVLSRLVANPMLSPVIWFCKRFYAQMVTGGTPYYIPCTQSVSSLLQVSRIIGRIRVLSRLVANPMLSPVIWFCKRFYAQMATSYAFVAFNLLTIKKAVHVSRKESGKDSFNSDFFSFFFLVSSIPIRDVNQSLTVNSRKSRPP